MNIFFLINKFDKNSYIIIFLYKGNSSEKLIF